MPTSVSSLKFNREYPIVRLYAVLVLSFTYFLIQLIVAHVAHSLILQINAYHMLYNILSLTTSVITTKMCQKATNVKNTFGWTRIDVCGAVSSLCFLSALCFSVVVEALQAMLHSSHHEKSHYPLWVGAIGIMGLVVNSLTFCIIGGYTYQQKGFLGSRKDGEDLVISPTARRGPTNHKRKFKHTGPLDSFRDFFGCILVIIVSIILYYCKDPTKSEQEQPTDFVDPLVTILDVFILGALSYKFARDAGYILLLTIPDNIKVKSLLEELYNSFPEICDIHEFHIWQLTPARIIASAHVVLRNTSDCWAIQKNIVEFLLNKGISHVTLQPEFLEVGSAGTATPQTLKKRQCFLPCGNTDDCQDKKCCENTDDSNSNSDQEQRSKLSPCRHHDHLHKPTNKNGRKVGSIDLTVLKSISHTHRQSSPELHPAGRTNALVFNTAEVHTHHHHSDGQSSEDELHPELKPMI